MYVEIKQPSSGNSYVYLKRSVRVHGKVKHITVERYGDLKALQEQDPQIIEKLRAKCAEGSVDVFSRKLLTFDNNIKKVMADASNNSYQDLLLGKKQKDKKEDKGTSMRGDFMSDPLSQSVLFARPVSKLRAEGKNLIYNTYGMVEPEDNDSSLLLPRPCMDAVVPAAGIGKRMGTSVPKQYIKLDDKCILEHTVLKLLSSPYISRVIVVLHPEDEYFKLTCLNDIKRVKHVIGGEERVDSVLSGLKEVSTPWALVHDAARPLICVDEIENLLYQVALGCKEGYCGGILACQVADTLKMQESERKRARHHHEIESSLPPTLNSDLEFLGISKSVDRSTMYRAQTPQLFKKQELIEAIEACMEHKEKLTDEASAMENAGRRVLMVPSDPLNFKITEPSDLVIAKALISYCAPRV